MLQILTVFIALVIQHAKRTAGGREGGQADTTKLIVAFRNLRTRPKKRRVI